MSKHIFLILSCLSFLPLFSPISVANAAAPAAVFVAPPAAVDPDPATEPQEEFSDQFLYRVTARVIGEGNFAIPQIACTVRNRWRALQPASLSHVLRAYYAPDKVPQQWQIDLVRKVFTGELPCPETWWYALSLQDTSYWTPHDRIATIVRLDAKYQIWIYER